MLTNFFKKFILQKDGKEGLELFENQDEINIILTDINMPILNGIEMIKKFEFDRKIPVIF